MVLFHHYFSLLCVSSGHSSSTFLWLSVIGSTETYFGVGFPSSAHAAECSRRVTQIAGVIFLAYGLCPKLAYILSGIPRSVIGAVFLISAATIMFSGIDSIISDKRSLRNTLVAGTTLALAIMLPYHCASTYSAWAKSLPAFLNMLCTSTVFIAVVAGVLLNLILNYVLKDKNEK